MKKIALFMGFALLSAGAFAQKAGDMAVGVNLGFAPCLEEFVDVTNFGVGAKFQYNLTDPIRVEADVNYWTKSKEIGMLEIGANVHYLFHVGEKFSVYPLVGLGFVHFTSGNGGFGGYDDDDDDSGFMRARAYDDDDDDYDGDGGSDENKFMFNVGAGVQYALSEKISVGAEIKYQFIKDFNRMPISVGLTYKF